MVKTKQKAEEKRSSRDAEKEKYTHTQQQPLEIVTCIPLE